VQVIPQQLDGDERGVVHLPALLSDEFGVSRSDARMHIVLGTVEIDGVPSEEKLDFRREEIAGKTIIVRSESRSYTLHYFG
jgi:hypothetical protein